MPRKILIVAFVLALTVGVFARTVNHHFIIWDDDKNIYENPYLISDPIGTIPNYWKHPFRGLYIPITYTVWSFLASVSDKQPNLGTGPVPQVNAKLYHLTNLLFHLGSVCLVLLLLHEILGRRDLFAAALGASLFAIHPLQVESVAWATGLKDVMSCFLGLICTFVYMRFVRELENARARHAWIAYGGAILIYIAALLVKPHLVIIPAILSIIVFTLQGGTIQHALAKRPPYYALIPFFLIALAFVILTMGIQPDQDTLFPYVIPSIPQRFIVALDALTFYLSKIVWPIGLTPEPGRNPATALANAKTFPIWLTPILLLIPLLRIRNHRRYYYSAIAIALVGILPNLGFIPFAFQGQSTVADRYFYMAMIGVSLFLATFLTHTKSPIPRYILIAILPIMAFFAARQTALWKSTFTLYAHALKQNPEGVAATYNLALAHQNEGDFATAYDFYKRTIKLKDDFSNPYNNLGNGLNKLGRYSEALEYLLRGIELADDDYPGIYMNAGSALSGLGRYEEALTYFDKALELKPMYPACMVNIGFALSRLDRPQEALESYKRAIKYDSSLPQSYRGIADVLSAQGDHQGAIQALWGALNCAPEDFYAWRTLAKELAAAGDTGNAVKAADKAFTLALAANESMEVIGLLERELASYNNGKLPTPGE